MAIIKEIPEKYQLGLVKIAMLKKAVTVLESRKSELRALTYQAEA